ncbi:hypothetical protein [Dactylosporangium sp. CA-092794]|uniref:hypothetical protein n=1 Tax=Dactylosporangium sp. CA-092794 TaxID=3239929 RepID=UPI003D94459C
MDDPTSPRFPGYAQSRPERVEDLVAAVEKAVGRTSGRGALGPIASGARVLIVTWDHQDPEILQLISEAMLRAGAASVDSVRWSQMGLPVGRYSAADGWRELSEIRIETVVREGERVEQRALKRYLEEHTGYTTVYAGDAGEGHYRISIGDAFKANWMYHTFEELAARYPNIPGELQSLIERKMLTQFARAEEVRITDPEGTDIGWTVTAEEAELWARGAWIPWHMIGSTIEGVRFALVRPAFGGTIANSLEGFERHAARNFPTVNGVVAGTVNHSGFMPHIRVTVEEGRISNVEGGGEYGERLRAVIERYKDVQYPGYPKPGYHFFNDATIGSNVKCFRNAETLWNTGIPWTGLGAERYRAGVIHFGFGAEHEDPRFVEFGRSNGVPVKHMPHVHAYFATYRIKDRATGQWFDVVKDGWLTVLDDPEVRALAASLGDAEDLLSYDWVPTMPGINYDGDYHKDYGADPVAWVKRDIAGEFAKRVE